MAGEQQQAVRFSTYVVQVRHGDEWCDAETIKVRPRTKRRQVIEQALVGLVPPLGEVWEVRVLDEDSAHVTRVGSKARDPELVIGVEEEASS
jgi:hypothetical protein